MAIYSDVSWWPLVEIYNVHLAFNAKMILEAITLNARGDGGRTKRFIGFSFLLMLRNERMPPDSGLV
jgi:hypothetical protein